MRQWGVVANGYSADNTRGTLPSFPMSVGYAGGNLWDVDAAMATNLVALWIDGSDVVLSGQTSGISSHQKCQSGRPSYQPESVYPIKQSARKARNSVQSPLSHHISFALYSATVGIR